MLKNEQKTNDSMKKDKKAITKELDLNTGVVLGAASGKVGGHSASSSSASSSTQGGGSNSASTRASTSGKAGGDQGADDEPDFVLDKDISAIRRKTLAIRSDNVLGAVTASMGQINESVTKFQEMTENNAENDIVAQYNAQKENYEKTIEKLRKRLVKQTS